MPLNSIQNLLTPSLYKYIQVCLSQVTEATMIQSSSKMRTMILWAHFLKFSCTSFTTRYVHFNNNHWNIGVVFRNFLCVFVFLLCLLFRMHITNNTLKILEHHHYTLIVFISYLSNANYLNQIKFITDLCKGFKT